MADAFNQGHQAHADHKRRTDNPYMALAAEWDRGWRKRQVDQLTASGKGLEAARISGFAKFVKEHLR